MKGLIRLAVAVAMLAPGIAAPAQRAVDVHSHIITEEYTALLRRHGAELEETFERVCDVIRETAGLDDVEMKPESTLEEIGLDSLGTVEILVAVEDEFGIQLDTEENPKTVGEFADTVEAALEK